MSEKELELLKPTRDNAVVIPKRKGDANPQARSLQYSCHLLRVADGFLALHVIAPLTVSFWRGTWEAMGPLPPWSTLTFGVSVHFVFSLARGAMAKRCDPRKYKTRWKRNSFKVLSRVYVYVFGAACVSHWRGLWLLLDGAGSGWRLQLLLWLPALLLLLGSRTFRNTMAPPLAVGRDRTDGCYAFTTAFRAKVQHPLAHWLHPDKHRLLYYVVSRVYTALFSFCCVNSFRGVWKALDQHTGLNPTTVAALTGVSVVALGVMRALRNISAPPFVIVTDNHENYFQVPTMFHTSSKQTLLYILDCLFSVLVVHTLVVFVWRGAWCMFDIFLYPKRYEWSAWGSLMIGYCITLMAFSLQPCMMSFVQRLSGWSRVLVVDAYHLFSFFGTVNVWRGVWNLLNFYFLPNNPVASNWISHLLPFLLLVLLNCANSILVRGVYIDAEEEGGQCVEFPIYYLRLFFQNRRRKKLMRQHALGKRPSGGSSGGVPRSALLAVDNNHHHHHLHHQNHSPSPPSSRKGSREQPVQACLSHGLSHGLSHAHAHQHIRVQLPLPESPV